MPTWFTVEDILLHPLKHGGVFVRCGLPEVFLKLPARECVEQPDVLAPRTPPRLQQRVLLLMLKEFPHLNILLLNPQVVVKVQPHLFQPSGPAFIESLPKTCFLLPSCLEVFPKLAAGIERVNMDFTGGFQLLCKQALVESGEVREAKNVELGVPLGLGRLPRLAKLREGFPARGAAGFDLQPLVALGEHSVWSQHSLPECHLPTFRITWHFNGQGAATLVPRHQQFASGILVLLEQLGQMFGQLKAAARPRPF